MLAPAQYLAGNSYACCLHCCQGVKNVFALPIEHAIEQEAFVSRWTAPTMLATPVLKAIANIVPPARCLVHCAHKPLHAHFASLNGLFEVVHLLFKLWFSGVLVVLGSTEFDTDATMRQAATMSSTTTRRA